MLLLDFIFFNISFFSLMILLIYFYLFTCVSKCTNNQSFIFFGFSFFLLNFFILNFLGIELFSAILFLSEVVVFFYIFIVNLIRPNSIKKNSVDFYLICVFIFIILSVPSYNSFFNYTAYFWYNSFISLNNDVFGIFFFFYFFQPMSLIFVGSLLTLCTYLICGVTIFIQNSYNSFKKKNKPTFFFQKNQNKSYQTSKKPFFFSNFFL